MKHENKYKCKACGEILIRDNDKKWMPSYCSKTGRNVRLQLIKHCENYEYADGT